MAMQAPANAPLVCHGHSRPINHLEYSNVTEDGVFLISSSKGANPPRWLSRGSTARDHPAAREHTAVPIGKRASRVISKRLLFFLQKLGSTFFFPERTAEPPNRRTRRAVRLVSPCRFPPSSSRNARLLPWKKKKTANP
jgi:hypothetical protein